MSEQSAVMKDQVQKERDAAKQYQEELQVVELSNEFIFSVDSNDEIN